MQAEPIHLPATSATPPMGDDQRLLAELLRVARRFVALHYVDGNSPR